MALDLELDLRLQQRVADLMQAKPVRFQATGGGYTSARRGVVTFENGRSAFLKAATDEQTAEWLRAENAVYRHLDAAAEGDFLTEVLAWEDDGVRPVLILEDLSAAHWPPPWEPKHVALVSRLLVRLRQMPPMHGAASLENYRDDFHGWQKVAEDPSPFLALGLCSPAWLTSAFPKLIAAEEAVPLAGNDFLHLDVRSDNLCLLPGRAVLVDWNWACTGNGQFDLAAWLPSLHTEGGPAPETLLPDAPEMAAALSGFWAARAGSIGRDPRLCGLDLSQLRTALPWAARALDLPATGLAAY